VHDQDVSTAGGSITVPFAFQGAHDAFAVCLTPASSGDGGFPDGYHRLVVAHDSLCLDVHGAGGDLGQQLDQWQCENAPGADQDFFVR